MSAEAQIAIYWVWALAFLATCGLGFMAGWVLCERSMTRWFFPQRAADSPAPRLEGRGLKPVTPRPR